MIDRVTLTKSCRCFDFISTIDSPVLFTIFLFVSLGLFCVCVFCVVSFYYEFLLSLMLVDKVDARDRSSLRDG